MSDDKCSAMTALEPNYTRAFIHVFVSISFVIALAAAGVRVRTGHWWNAPYFESLAIPLFVFPIIVCFAFVPRRVDWSNAEFQIRPVFGTPRVFPWSHLVAFGHGRGVLLIQFSGRGAFQIYPGAFDRAAWRKFTGFLTKTFPDKRTRMWFGIYAAGTRND
jgi:hypothetical protein